MANRVFVHGGPPMALDHGTNITPPAATPHTPTTNWPFTAAGGQAGLAMTTHGRVAGPTKKKPGCACGGRVERDEEFDAYYCVDSGTWLESGCSDPECDFCVKRPERRATP